MSACRTEDADDVKPATIAPMHIAHEPAKRCDMDPAKGKKTDGSLGIAQ
jgi:hypothetical protein